MITAALSFRPLLSMDAQSVVHLGSFSKILAPGIRLGYVVAPLALARKVEQAKQGADLHTSTLTQMVAYEIIKDGFFDNHLVGSRKVYAEQCATMLQALQEHFPRGATWTKPTGGMFIWATLPEGLDAGQMLDAALDANVGYVPGGPFFAEAPLANTMRLSFAARAARGNARGDCAAGESYFRGKSARLKCVIAAARRAAKCVIADTSRRC